MPENDDISRLLRLKRYEQPLPEYFDKFLTEFHRRQRCELLRRSACRIAIERVQAFFGETAFSRLAYGAATAVVLVVAGITAAKIVAPGAPGSANLTQATTAAPAPADVPGESSNAPARNDQPEPVQVAKDDHQPAVLIPHYVIDARPVSYEPPPPFSF